MADLDGTWTPENDTEMEFISQANQLAQGAYDRGLDREDIAGGLAFLATTLMMQDPDEMPDQPPVPEGPDKVQECPECGDDIERVWANVGGPAVIKPCGHEVEMSEVEGWLDNV